MWHHRALARFTKWFGSGGGVWQTLVVTTALLLLELVFPNVDKHSFWLLLILTLYSGVTQPALAHAGAESNAMLHTVLVNQKNMLHNQADILERIEHMLNKDTIIDRKTYNMVRQIRDNMATDA
jgi:hypothetical protein